MRTALGIPDSVVGIDIDKQADLFARKFDITKLQDPAEVEKLIRKYAAISDVTNPRQGSTNAVVQLMQGAVSAGSYVPATIDITAISRASLSSYR